MKPALGVRQPSFPMSWQDLPCGDAILDNINRVLIDWWPKFFGYYMLKVGALSGEIASTTSPINCQYTVSLEKNNSDIIAEIDDLPIATHSVDVCLLSHILEFSIDPHHIIRESDRITIPNGYVVITGYNPVSLIGLNPFIPYRRKQTPWNERLFSPVRVKDWLQLMGFEIQLDHRFIHSSLSKNMTTNTLCSKWRNIAATLFPQFGSIYILVAKKRVRPLTPLKAKWQLRPKFHPTKVPTMHTSGK